MGGGGEFPETGRPEIAHSSIRPEEMRLLFLNVCTNREEMEAISAPLSHPLTGTNSVFYYTPVWESKDKSQRSTQESSL